MKKQRLSLEAFKAKAEQNNAQTLTEKISGNVLGKCHRYSRGIEVLNSPRS